ncbi:hypothetical protein HDU76_013326 [Blyttiomyces sp. JEL0837]|nr:hypothetical protein HDU76_013326 [Blyttiomyces sp. JEL0837]
MSSATERVVKLTVIAADGLHKRQVFRLPDPYAVITVDCDPSQSPQTHHTTAVKRTLNPYWNESFDITVKNTSTITIQIFDQRNNSGLGVMTVEMSKVFDIAVGGDEMVTHELKRSANNEPVSGKLIVSISTNPGSSASAAAAAAAVRSTSTAATTAPSSNSPASVHNSLPPSESGVANGTPAAGSVGGGSAPAPANAAATPASDSEEPLPPGWESRTDTRGRTYYVDHNSRRTTWLRPTNASVAVAAQTQAPISDMERQRFSNRQLPGQQAPPPGTETPSAHTAPPPTAASNSSAANAANAATGPLPAGWEQRFTPEGRAYFVDHNTRTTTWVDPRRSRTSSPQNGQMTAGQAQAHLTQVMAQSTAAFGPLPSGWEMRITNTNRIYFVDHNSKITTWDDPRLPSSTDQNVPQYKRDFRRKLVYFRSQPAIRPSPGQCHITVRRANIFEDAYAEIMRHPAGDLKKKLFIKFQGEDGLFEYSAHDNYTLQINPHSGINPEHLNYFKFIGRVVGLGIFHQRFLDSFFVTAFYKMILGRRITLKDMESVDATQYRSLQWMLDNPIAGVLDDLTFTVENEVFGELVEVELKEGGKDITVSDENKKEYVELVTLWRIVKRVDEQFSAIKQGFNEIIPQDLINVFDERELELLIGGLADIDVDDWKKNTDYRGYTENDDVIQQFWKAVRSWDNEKKANLLQFVTGTSRIPVNGFKDLQGSDGPRRFTIEKTGEIEQLPKSHTWTVKPNSLVVVQIFDQKKWKKTKDQGFLGVINLQIGVVFDLARGGDEMITQDLRKAGGNDAVSGKLIVNISTNFSNSAIAAGSSSGGAGMSLAAPSIPVGSSSSSLLDPNSGEVGLGRTPSTTSTTNLPTFAHANATGGDSSAQAAAEAASSVRKDGIRVGAPAGSGSSSSAQANRQLSSFEDHLGPLPSGWERRTDQLGQQRYTPEGRSYFVDHNTRTTTWLDPRRDRRTTGAGQPTGGAMTAGQAQAQLATAIADTNAKLGPLPSGWEMRITNTNRIYFVDHNSKITTWDDPRLPSNVDQNVPQYKRDFRRKLVYFRSQPAMRTSPGNCHITVRRANIFEDAYSEIMRNPAADLKKKLFIKFHGEDGLDYGGLGREFFFLMSKEMFNPFYCLFEYSAHDNYTLQINPHSGINPEHLNYFKFIGRVVGLGIFHQRFLDAFFVPAFYKMILGRKITLKDMESVDADLHRSMQWMLDNPIADVLDLTFTTDNEVFGEVQTVELKPGGKDIPVTDENKKEYVELITEWRISKRVEEQFRAFQQGFNEIIPPELINVFDERELELLIGGLADIDVDDWKKHTDYRGFTENDETIQNFWKAVRSWDNEKRANLLQFVTGTSRIPVNGFKDLQGSDGPRRFTIEKTGTLDQLPKSHTCFNRLDLPPYKTYDQLDKKLTLAIEETVGFLQE